MNILKGMKLKNKNLFSLHLPDHFLWKMIFYLCYNFPANFLFLRNFLPKFHPNNLMSFLFSFPFLLQILKPNVVSGKDGNR